jgi:hypothetical protein
MSRTFQGVESTVLGPRRGANDVGRAQGVIPAVLTRGSRIRQHAWLRARGPVR